MDDLDKPCIIYFCFNFSIRTFRRKLQGTLRIINECNDYVQNQIVNFEEWCNFIFYRK
jgi:hypothetical protein